MFNLGLKSDITKRGRLGNSRLSTSQPRFNRGQHEHMVSQVKKILEQKGQGLIVMVRS